MTRTVIAGLRFPHCVIVCHSGTTFAITNRNDKCHAILITTRKPEICFQTNESKTDNKVGRPV